MMNVTKRHSLKRKHGRHPDVPMFQNNSHVITDLNANKSRYVLKMLSRYQPPHKRRLT